MSNSEFATWWDDGGWRTDSAQNRKISDLEDQLAHASHRASTQSRRLQSELSKVRGTLEQRLDRITASFDAFVELSDVRMLLVPFAEYGLVRHQVRQLLDGHVAGVPDTDETPDYWLAPAARGLRAALTGNTGTAQRYFAEAAQHDPARSGVFALLSVATAGEAADGERAAPFADWILPSLLSELAREVTRYERALWLLAADGLLGPGAREHVRGLLVAAVERHPRAAETASAWVDFRASPRPAAKAKAVQNGLVGTESVSSRLDAARRLAELRSWLEEEAARGPEADQTFVPDAYAVETLRLLVEEGGPQETALVRRVNQLRRVVETSGGVSPDEEAPRWDEPAGDVLDLLTADSTARDAPPARRAFVVGVLAPRILAGAGGLAEQARTEPADGAAFVHRRNRVKIDSGGADRADLAAAEGKLALSYVPEGGRGRIVWAGVAAGSLLVLGLVTGAVAVFSTLAVVAVVVGGWFFVDNRQTRRTQAEALAGEERDLRRGSEEAVRAWRALREQAAQAAAGAQHDLETVRRLLTRS